MQSPPLLLSTWRWIVRDWRRNSSNDETNSPGRAMNICLQGECMKECRFRFIAVVLVLFIARAPTFGQPSPAASTPASRQDVLKLFKVMHIHDQMRSVMDSMTKQQSALV